MADNQRVDPLKNFRFRVEIQGVQTAAFANATIPSESVETVSYREGTDPFTRKLSGQPSFGTLTLKKGVTMSTDLYDWWTLIRQSGSGAPGGRRHLSIVLVDASGNDSARWNVFNAWPSKMEHSDFDAKGNDVLIETVEITLENIVRAS